MVPRDNGRSSESVRLVTGALLGTVLVGAAVLKGQDLIFAHGTSSRVDAAPWLLLVPIHFELLLGCWLLSGLYRRAVTMVALMAFCCFVAVAISKGLAGEDSCGCFGRVKVNPWLTAGFDLAAIFALLLTAPTRSSDHVTRAPTLRAAALACAAIVSLAWVAYLFTHRQATAVASAQDLPTAGGLVLLEPEQWLGKRLPVLAHIDAGEQLATGEWIVVIYHHDCHTCEEAIPQYQQQALGNNKSPRLSLVQMPPYASGGRDPAGESPAWTRGKLSDKHEWFATTPLALALRDGVVLKAVQGKDAKDPSAVVQAFGKAAGGDAESKLSALD